MTTEQTQNVTESGKITDNIEEIARHFGKSKRTIFRWKKAGMPMLSDGRFNLEEIQKWINNKKQGAGNGDKPEPPTTGRFFWDAENKKFQAKARELDYLKKRGELVEREKVEELFAGRIRAVKAGLLSLERSLPPELAACKNEREMAAVIRRAVYSLLETYSRPLPKTISSEEGRA